MRRSQSTDSMKGTTLDRLVAAGVFIYALILYVLTVAPTVSFWDPGEFIAVAYRLEVGHPPGAPFYALLGRLFAVVLGPVIGLFQEEGHIAVAVNLVSVLASALTVLLTHLIIVRLVRIWQGPPEAWGALERLAALGGGVVGACAFAATDSFWFNAVEAEVYALSMFFTAVVVWLALRWRDEKMAEEAALRAVGQHPFGLASDRYLVLIAYLFGLAIGVHLLNLLALFFIALIVFFVEFESEAWPASRRWLGIVATGAVSTLAFFLIYPGIIQGLPSLAEASSGLALIAVAAALVGAVRVTQRRRMPVANLLALAVMMVVLGYSTYALILIRSIADPPIDENDPETIEAFVSYLKREQYGATPLLKGPTFDNRTGQVDDRSGREVFFPRRWSPMPQHERVYAQYGSDWEFFRKYQLGHMYFRYFMWQFAGRASDLQDASWTLGLKDAKHRILEYLTVLKLKGEPPTEATPSELPAEATPSERAGRTVYYGLPLLLGLIGLAFHVVRDWRRAFAVAVLFFVTGIGIILYLNQTPIEPRERDYSYVGSFFAFSLWIGIGATGLIALAGEALAEGGKGARAQLAGSGAAAAALFAAVPLLMVTQNFDAHDRSGNYVAPDFAYNMLQSVAPNAILFTNGDNDTFPLWYLQEVEGLRTDVRVANLSLLQTDWYILQLKNQRSRESAPVPMRLTDEQIRGIRPVEWRPREISLPVQGLPEETLAQLGRPENLPDSMTWRLEGRRLGEDFYVLYVNDLVVLSILEAVAADNWERPVYFATTTASDAQLGLEPFLQNEGLANRIVPIKAETAEGRVVPDILTERLEGFRLRRLDDPSVYFDQNARGMIDNYRTAVFAPAARRLAQLGHEPEARRLLERLEREVPFEIVTPTFASLYLLAGAYEALGDAERVLALMRRAEPHALELLGTPGEQNFDLGLRFYRVIQTFYLELGAFEAASAFSAQVAEALGDGNLYQSPEELRRIYEAVPDEMESDEMAPDEMESEAGIEAVPDETVPDEG